MILYFMGGNLIRACLWAYGGRRMERWAWMSVGEDGLGLGLFASFIDNGNINNLLQKRIHTRKGQEGSA
jgi:hypothetical protein